MAGTSRFIYHDMFWVRDKSFYKNLIVLAIPIILQNVITFGVSLADNIMIGQLGEVPIAALHIGTKVQGVLQIILFGVESALIILSSQYWGKRDTDHIKDVISIALRLTFVVTAPMAFIAFFLPEWFVGLITDNPDIIRCCAEYLRILAVSYLIFGISMTLLCAMRSVEMVRIGLINSVVALFVNVVLNYVLIFGNCGFPRMEVRGAAIATFIARFIELAVVAI
ncbi:MAG: polysaccharide biosynthesis C-terminal domain-containing protein, partial [Victivallales bacterium]|nr:polysaccharide biosynthesis C-terminal domain-containing protein [Victivallales bacterium]